jgi:hypothetical protein
VSPPTSTPSSELIPTPVLPTLARVLIEPQQVVLEPCQSYVFTVNAWDTEGQVISYLGPAEVSWSARGKSGTIDSMGEFKATTKAGVYSYAVEVTVHYKGATATDTAEVVVTPGPLSSLTLTPRSLTTEVDGQQQFLVQGRDAYGNEIPDLNLEWQVDPSAGTIDSSTGLFSAGTKAGEYPNAVRVVANYKGADLEATAAMTVEPGPLSNLMLAPTSITTEVQRTVQFTVRGVDAYSNEIPNLNPAWQVLEPEAGVIDQASGLFSAATKAGEYPNAVRVIGNYKGGHQEAAAAVIVEPGPLASLTLAPTSITTQILQKGQFAVKGTDDYGNEISNLNLAWQVDPSAGTIDPDSGTFSAGTKTGEYHNAIRVLASYKGVSQEALASVLVEPGPVQQATLSPSTSEIFTGDSIPFTVAASDAYGNPISNPGVAWSASLGEVDSSGRFTAGRQPGTAQVTATVSDGKATIQTSQSLNIRMGYCNTTPQVTTWRFEWYALNNDQSQGAFLGTSNSDGNFRLDWGFGPVFQGRGDFVMLMAKSSIVVQREGPVLFRVTKDDAIKLYLNGTLIMESSNYRETPEKSIMLGPGIYGLELHYYEWTGKAALTFETDEDVLQWTTTGQCFGGFTQSPSTRYFVHEPSGKTLAEVADQFGVSSGEAFDLNKMTGSSLLLPGSLSNTSKTRVILIQGIDSRGDCSETDGTLARRHLMVRAIQTLWPSVNQTASQIDDGNVIGFSYSGRYMDCDTAQQYTAYDFPGATLIPDIQRNSLLPLTPAPMYSPGDTCDGVKNASQHLEALINQILRLEPDARFVLIGHSLGGMVAAYYVSQQPAAFVEEKIQKVVTVDSPLLSFSERHPNSACPLRAQSWQDIFGNSDVVPAIGGIRNQPMVEKFYAINSTDIGDALTEKETGFMTLGCASVRTGGGAVGGSFLSTIIGAAVGGPAGLFIAIFGSGVSIGAYSHGHSCAFADETALRQISTLINDSFR